MDSGAVTSNLTMLRVNGWQLYAWRDGDSVTLIDTGAPGTFNQDKARTVASVQRLAALDVDTACFGHGEPIASGAGARIREMARQL